MVSSRRTSEGLVFAALALGTWTYAVSQTMLIPSLPDIEASFDTTSSGASALMTSFWISGAVTAATFGRLGDMLGKRRMIAAQLALFALGAVACALAPALGLMIAGRVLMGCGVGIFPLAYSVLRDELRPERVVGAIALLGSLLATGAALGQATGGLVSDHLGFAWVFWISAVSGVASLVALFAFVPESPRRTGGRVDAAGALLLALGLGAPLYAVAEAPTRGWLTRPTLTLFALGACVLTAFTAYELRRDAPLLDIRTLRLPRVRLTNVATLFAGAAFFGSSTLVTQFLQEPESTGYGPGLDATQAGLFFLPGLLVLMLTSPLAGRLSSARGPALTARLGLAVGSVGTVGLVLAHPNLWAMALWQCLIYVGVAALFGAMPALILESVSASQSGQSTSVNMILRNVGLALGVQLGATFVTSSAPDGGLPTARGYTAAFLVQAIAGLVALVVSFAIPGRRRA